MKTKKDNSTTVELLQEYKENVLKLAKVNAQIDAIDRLMRNMGFVWDEENSKWVQVPSSKEVEIL
jgi:hypothetical protein